jgi:hypothetical protein
MAEPLPPRSPRREETRVAGIAATASLAVFVVGWLFFHEVFYGHNPTHTNPLVVWMLGAWGLGLFAGALAVNLIYGVVAESKAAIAGAGVLGIVLNGLTLAGMLLLYWGLQGIGR